MTVKLEDRPIETVREQVIDTLIVNYSHGEISSVAFERRLDDAMNAKENQVLMDLIADLPRTSDKQYHANKDAHLGVNYSSEPLAEDKIVTVLSANEQKGAWRVPKTLKVTNIMSSSKLDFTNAVFTSQEVHLKIMCIMGDEAIYVPENVNVVFRTFNVLGNTESKLPSLATKQAPTIYIEGWVILGNIEAGLKRTMKERFMAFADELKASLGLGSDHKY